MNDNNAYILKSVSDGVATLTLNRGDKFNPLSEVMLAALQAALDAAIGKLPASILVKPAQTMACNMMDEAALEGVQAFIDKRKPVWLT